MRGAGPLASALVSATAALLVAACAGPFAGDERGDDDAEWRESRRLFDVDVRIAVRAGDEDAARLALADAFTAARDVGALLLASHPGSEIDVLCHVPNQLWIEISPVTHAALVLAARIATETDGAYDPTWPPLLSVWGLRGAGPPRVPREFEIEMALRRVDFSDIEVSEEGDLQARRLSRRTEIDLGGLARGAMLDAAVEQLRKAGIQAGRADTDTEHVVFGGTARAPWQIAIVLQPARDGSGSEGQGESESDEPSTVGTVGTVGTVELRDGALAVARRGPLIATADGAVIHDHFDPRSGRPAPTHWVALAAPHASEGAGYADAVFAMGSEGRGFVEGRSDLLAVIAIDDAVDPEAVADPGGESIWASPALRVRLAR